MPSPISYDSDIFVQAEKESADHYIFVATALNKTLSRSRSNDGAPKGFASGPFAFTTIIVRLSFVRRQKAAPAFGILRLPIPQPYHQTGPLRVR